MIWCLKEVGSSKHESKSSFLLFQTYEWCFPPCNIKCHIFAWSESVKRAIKSSPAQSHPRNRRRSKCFGLDLTESPVVCRSWSSSVLHRSRSSHPRPGPQRHALRSVHPGQSDRNRHQPHGEPVPEPQRAQHREQRREQTSISLTNWRHLQKPDNHMIESKQFLDTLLMWGQCFCSWPLGLFQMRVIRFFTTPQGQ